MLKKINKKSIFYFIIFVLILYVLFLDNSSIMQRIKYELKIKQLQSEIDNLQSENNQLEKENIALEKDPVILEEKARELGMQKENEEVFIFKEDDTK